MILINSMAKISKIVFSSLRKGIFLSLESFADEIPETELFSRPDLGVLGQFVTGHGSI